MAREQGFTVDLEGFEAAMSGQRERARQSGKAARAERTAGNAQILRLGESAGTEFIGYTDLETPDARVIGYSHIGGRVRLILDRTPFYAESGGQVGDTGWIAADGWRVDVEDAQKAGDDILHMGRLTAGEEEFLQAAQSCFPNPVTAHVSFEHRLRTARNHTATHLLQAALRQILGEHVAQAGSLVHPDYLRFDYTHFAKPSEGELDQVEELVNAFITRALPVVWEMTTVDRAKEHGAMALFDAKYGKSVRLVSIGNVSAELCGGTHVRSTDQLLAFRITSESAVAAGVRRIEAVTGDTALDKRMIRSLQDVLSARGGDVLEKVVKMTEDQKALVKQLELMKASSADSEVVNLIAHAQEIGGVRLVTALYNNRTMEDLKTLGDALRAAQTNLVAVLGSALEGKASLAVVVTDDLIRERGLSAGMLVKEIAAVMGGGGGGRHHLGTAGSKSAEKLPQAIQASAGLLEKKLKKTADTPN